MGLPFDLLSAAPLNATRPRRVEDLAGPERSRRPGWRSGRRGEGYEAGPRGCPAKTPPSPLPPIDPATRGPAGPPLHPPCLRIQRVGLSRVDRHVPESPPTRPAPCRSSAAPGGATPATSVRDMCHQALCHRPRAGFGDALAEQDGRLLCAPHPDRSPRPIRHSRRPQQRLRLAITACPRAIACHAEQEPSSPASQLALRILTWRVCWRLLAFGSHILLVAAGGNPLSGGYGLGARRSRRRTSLHVPRSRPRRSRLPTMRNPQAWWRATLAWFSGKMPVWMVQIPAWLAASMSASRMRRPIPRPCQSRWT